MASCYFTQLLLFLFYLIVIFILENSFMFMKLEPLTSTLGQIPRLAEFASIQRFALFYHLYLLDKRRRHESFTSAAF